ncbi:two-component regulator propeller domain-containing protein [Verrucomicrobiaceae bacterium 227]
MTAPLMRLFGLLLPNLLICLCLAADDTRWAVKSWTTGDGLPQNTVLAMAQTDDGFLWVGTRGGLARFDGINFEILGIPDGLLGVDIAALATDKSGGLWVGTFGGGVAHLKNGGLKTLTTEDGLAHNNALILVPAFEGGVWVGGTGGLQHVSDDGLTNTGEIVGLPKGEILEMDVDSRGGLWISIGGTGLVYLKGHQWEIVKDEKGVSIPSVRDLLVDDNGSLWVSIGNSRLLHFEEGHWHEYNASHGLPLSYISCLGEDSAGRIWAGTHEGGLYVLDLENGSFGRVEIGGGSSEAIRSLFPVDDMMFVGRRGGLTRLLERQVQFYPAPGGGSLYGFTRDTAGDFLFCCYGGGVHKGPLVNLEKITNVPLLNEIPFGLTGMTNSAGRTFVIGAGWVMWFEKETDDGEILSINETVISIAEGHDGMYVGTRSGKLLKIEGNEFREIATVGVPISGLIPAGPDKWWISTRGRGLFHLSEDGLKNWGREEGLPTEIILSIQLDDEGILWIGTGGGGLVCLRNDEVVPLGVEGDLKNDLVTQILEDEEGNLWLGTQRGILRVPRQGINEAFKSGRKWLHSTLLNREDGLEVEDCPGGFHPAGMRAEDGKLYFSTVGGIAEIDPQRFTGMKTPQKILVNRVTRNGVVSKTRSFAPGVRDLEFHFTAFNYRNPDQVRFRYRLPQLDSAWVDVGSRRQVNFPSLAAGDYRFEVNAGTGHALWSNEIAGYDFTVQAAYWETKWFQGLMGALLVAMGGGVVWLVARSRLAVSEMDLELAGKHAELLQQKHKVTALTDLAILGELSASLAHEINQPLTGILSNAQAAKRFLARDGFDASQIEEILDDIIDDDQRASQVIERVRGVLKKQQFVSENLGVNELITEVVLLLKGDLQEREILIDLHLDRSLGEVKGDRVQLQQVLINVIFNAADAMKGMPAEERDLKITTTKSRADRVMISVRDLGHGIAIGEEENIFESFHTTKEQGFGLGLSLSRTIIRGHGGRMWAENNSGPGATIYFTLPL